MNIVSAFEIFLDKLKKDDKLSYRENKVLEAALSHDCWYECKKCNRIINGSGNDLIETYQGKRKHCYICGWEVEEE